MIICWCVYFVSFVLFGLQSTERKEFEVNGFVKNNKIEVMKYFNVAK